MGKLLSRAFYEDTAVEVAPKLIGCRLVRIFNGIRMAGVISETEAYQGQTDLGCHAHAGLTPRTAVMYGEAGHAYIYFTYGMHWLFNVVTEPKGKPSAVLIRAVFPVEGLDQMAILRPMLASKPGWLNGPAKLAQALGLDGKLNNADLCSQKNDLFIEENLHVPTDKIISTSRIGLGKIPEPWRSIPWRWVAEAQTIQEILAANGKSL